MNSKSPKCARCKKRERYGGRSRCFECLALNGRNCRLCEAPLRGPQEIYCSVKCRREGTTGIKRSPESRVRIAAANRKVRENRALRDIQRREKPRPPVSFERRCELIAEWSQEK